MDFKCQYFILYLVYFNNYIIYFLCKLWIFYQSEYKDENQASKSLIHKYLFITIIRCHTTLLIVSSMFEEHVQLKFQIFNDNANLTSLYQLSLIFIVNLVYGYYLIYLISIHYQDIPISLLICSDPKLLFFLHANLTNDL